MSIRAYRMLTTLLLGLLVGVPLATAAPAQVAAPAPVAVQAFAVDSLASIVERRRGQPFILSFWSLACTHCPAELKALGALKKRWPTLEVVLVATDPLTMASAAPLRDTLRRHGLGQAEAWAFGDQPEEHLRFAIDRRWYGELPRTYFYTATHEVHAVSGVAPAKTLEQWARAHLTPASGRAGIPRTERSTAAGPVPSSGG